MSIDQLFINVLGKGEPAAHSEGTLTMTIHVMMVSAEKVSG